MRTLLLVVFALGALWSAAARNSLAAAAPPVVVCGDDPLPVCPMQGYMQAALAPTLKRRDLNALAGHFRTLAGYAPVPAMVKLATKTRIPSLMAESHPDSPEVIRMFEQALKELGL